MAKCTYKDNLQYLDVQETWIDIIETGLMGAVDAVTEDEAEANKIIDNYDTAVDSKGALIYKDAFTRILNGICNQYEVENLNKIQLISSILDTINQIMNSVGQDYPDTIPGLLTGAEFKKFVHEYFGVEYILTSEHEDKTIGELLEPIYRDPVSAYYGEATTAKTQFLARVVADMFSCSFINLNTLTRITNRFLLNSSIASYKESLYETLYNFLNKAGVDVRRLNTLIYNPNILTTVDVRSASLILKLAEDYFKNKLNMNSDYIRTMYKNRNLEIHLPTSEEQSTNLTNEDKINAFEAFVLLHEEIFDKLLHDNNANIKINGIGSSLRPVTTRDMHTKEIYYKYEFGHANNYYKGWLEQDIDATQLMGNLASLIITRIPIIDPTTKRQIRNDFMSKDRFFKVFSIIKQPSTYKYFSKKALQLILNLHKSPARNYKKLLETLIEEWPTYTNIPESLDAEGLRVLVSTYLYVFGINDINNGEKPSLYQLDLQYVQQANSCEGFFLVDIVAGALIRTEDASYISYKHNGSAVAPITIQKRVSDQIEIDLSNQWDFSTTSNYLNEDRLDLINQYNIVTKGNKDNKAFYSTNIPVDAITFTLTLNNEGTSKNYNFYYNPSGDGAPFYYTVEGDESNTKHTLQSPSLDNLRQLVIRNGVCSQVSENDKLVYEFFKFFDLGMHTNYTGQLLYDLLETIINRALDTKHDNYLELFMNLLCSAIHNHVAYLKFSAQTQEKDITKFVLDEHYHGHEHYTTAYGYHFLNENELKLVTYTNSDKHQTLRKIIADAKLETAGTFYKSIIKNALGNTIASNKMSNLAMRIPFLIMYSVIENEGSAIKDNLFAQNLSSLQEPRMKTEIDLGIGMKKTLPNFTESELAFSSIFYDFYHNIYAGMSLRTTANVKFPLTQHEVTTENALTTSHVAFQATTYSDKPTDYLNVSSVKYWIKNNDYISDDFKVLFALKYYGNLPIVIKFKNLIAANQELTQAQRKVLINLFNDNGGFCIDLIKSSKEDIDQAIYGTIGMQYRSIFHKVLDDYRYNLDDYVLIATCKSDPENNTFKNILNKINSTDGKWRGTSNIALLLSDDELLEVMQKIRVDAYTQTAWDKYIIIPKLELSGLFEYDKNGYLTINEEFLNLLKNNPNEGIRRSYTTLLKHFRSILTNNVIEQLNEEQGDSFTAGTSKNIETYKDTVISSFLSDTLVLELITYLTKEEYEKLASVTHHDVIEELHTTKKYNGLSTKYVHPNSLLLFYATLLFGDIPVEKNEIYQNRIIQELHKFLKNIIKFNIKLQYRFNNRIQGHISHALKVLGYANDDAIEAFMEEWGNPNTDLLYLAKDKNNKLLTEEEISALDTNALISGDFTLNPLLEKFFMSNYLLSENMRIVSTGASFVHKDSHDFDTDPLMNAIKELASRESTLYKRQVIIPGTVQYFSEDCINGIPSKIKTAVISDTSAATFNILGDAKRDNDAHDGSGFNHPMTTNLENNSLLDLSVGEDMKLITHINLPYGVVGLEKYAVFTMTNERMRLSRFSPDSFYILVQNMSNEKFKTSPKLSHNIFGKKFANFLKEIKTGRLIFRGKGNRHFEVTNLEEIEGLDFVFRRTVVELDANGKVIPGSTDVHPYKIECIWDLMEALGGIYSEDFVNGKYIWGGQNIATATNYVNNIGEYNGDFELITKDGQTYKKPLELPTQSNTELPLKNSFIHTVTNASGFKNAISHRNGKEAWKKGTKLKFMVTDTYNMGPQMDADHIVVGGEHESQLTEPSQIISALEAMGNTHDISRQAYYDLGKVAINSIHDMDAATIEYLNSNKSEGKNKLYHTLGVLISKAILSDEKEVGTSAAVLKLIETEFKKSTNHSEDNLKIPFSDPNLFAKSIATFVSHINKTAIKRKFHGEGAVMVPAYNIMTYYYVPKVDPITGEIGYRKLLTDDIQKEACDNFPDDDVDSAMIQLLEAYQQLENKHPKTMDKLLPGDKVFVTTIVNGVAETKFYDTEDYDVYLQLRGHDVASGKAFPNMENATFTYAIMQQDEDGTVTPVSRNLRPLETYWSVLQADKKQVNYNLFELPEVIEAIQYRRDESIENQIKHAKNRAQALLDQVQSTDRNDTKWNSLYDAYLIANKECEDLIKANKNKNLQLQYQIQIALNKLNEGYMSISAEEVAKYNKNDIVVDTKTNKVYVKIIPNTLKTNAAEMMMSRIYADSFKLGENDTLASILDNPNYFDNTINITPAIDTYDVCFLTDSGRHAYISSIAPPETEAIPNTFFENNRSNFTENAQGVRFRVNPLTGESMYPVGKWETTKSKDGKVTKQYKLFVKFYKTPDNTEILVVNDPKTIVKIYESGSYTGILFNKNFKNQEFVDDLFKLFSTSKHLKRYIDFLNNDFNVDTIYDRTQTFLEQNKAYLSKRKYTSFLTSLDFVVGRIPAQAQQSFMKMRCVGLLNTNKNVVHVSHYQTWLQGSDYDIDKAYILGNAYNHNGIYIGWSPFFNYDSEDTLNKSMELPTPNGKIYTWETEDPKNAFVVDPYLNGLNLNDPTTTMNALINLLNAVDGKDSIICNSISPEVKTKVLDIINLHNLYLIRHKGIALDAFKNSVASKMRRIVSDPRNAAISYSPIGMGEPREAADSSQSGEAVKTMTSLDPFTVWIMTLLNMAGKKVIGIAATAEKIFFALSFYYNEMIFTKDEAWIKNGFLNQVLYKLGYTDPINHKEEIKQLFRHIIPNVNFYLNDAMKAKWEELVKKAFYKNIPLEEIEETLRREFNLAPDASLVISALLSAATDNAKELILDKINAGPEFAGLYMHMIIMGIDFSDISALMTSSTMEAIKNFTLTNLFDQTRIGSGDILKLAIKTARQGPSMEAYEVDNLFNSTFDTRNPNQPISIKQLLLAYFEKCLEYSINTELITLQEQLTTAEKEEEKNKIQEKINKLKNKKQLKMQEAEGKFATISTFKQFLQSNFLLFASCYKLFGNPLLHTDSNTIIYSKSKNLNVFLQDYVKTLSVASNINYDTLNAIDSIRKQSTITTTLGLAVLSSNQGFETDIAGKLKRLQKLEQIMTDAENDKNYMSPIILALQDKTWDSNVQAYAKTVVKRNPSLTQEEIIETLNEAKKLKIIGNFDMLKFLSNEEYKKVSISYYNLIRPSFNVFDVIDKVPHFAAIFKAYKDILTIDNAFAKKFRYARAITKKLVEEHKHYKTFQDEELENLITFIDSNLMCEWLNAENINVALGKGCEYFDSEAKRIPVPEGNSHVINLSTDEGRASFKLYVETRWFRNLSKGYVIDGNSEHYYPILLKNHLIQEATMTEQKDKISGIKIPYLKLPINMSLHNSISENSIYELYELDLKELSQIKAQDGLSVADMLFIYNLITNHNKFGADRLTSIFGRIITNENSEIFKYYKYMGDNDFIEHDTPDSIDLNDVLLNMAIVVGNNAADRQNATYIRIKYLGIDRTELRQRIKSKGASNVSLEGDESQDEGQAEALAEAALEGLADLGDFDEIGQRTTKFATKITNYIDSATTRIINSKPDDYFKYFTLTLPFMSSTLHRLLITNEDVLFDTDESIENFVLKIVNLVRHNSIVTDLICDNE